MPSPATPSSLKDASRSGGSTDLSASERMHLLIEWLRSGRQLTTPLAADAFGVSRRTIARDLAYLRDVLALDVTFDAEQHSYVLAEEHTALPFLAFPSLAPVLLNSRLASDVQEPGRTTISVRFSARAIQAYLARGGGIPDGAANRDGTLDVHFFPPNLDEFMCYVLSRGHDIEILGPPDFRRRVHMEIRRMLALYQQEPSPNA